MKTILTIVGARPQFIKAAAVSEILKLQSTVREIILHTGQHYDENMSALFFSELEIPPPEHNLGIGSGTHGTQTGRMLAGIEEVLFLERPDIVLVYGDTNSTLAGALAAAKLNIPVAHVEAGLRSFNKRMPEEVNRIITDHISTVLFSPTETAAANLEKEGIDLSAIHVVGDVMLDSLEHFLEKSYTNSKILEHQDLRPGEYILATIHRAENTDDPIRLEIIFEALIELSRIYKIIVPMHPRTRNVLLERKEALLNNINLVLLDPLGYLDILMLERNASLILTDSGGIQKEAYFHQVPCITLRDETEWNELVTSGWNRLVPPTSVAAILSAVEEELGNTSRPEFYPQLFGSGNAAKLIGEVLLAT